MYRRTFGIVLAVVCGPVGQALGWGATGHEWISGIAIEKLPDDVPAFVRTADTRAEIAMMGWEPDRSKGAGETHDNERDPGHYVNLTDDAKAMGIVPLHTLPVTREAYDTALRAGGSTQYKAGYLPYSIVDGWQQIRKDFGYWRAAVKGAETARSPAERAWFQADRRLREKLTLRDIGIWSHYVGEGSQPLNVTVHYNGWGHYPNPAGYTTSRIHAYFEGEFVRFNLKRAAVAAQVGPYVPCECTIQDMTRKLLSISLDNVAPLYELEMRRGFDPGSRWGVDFVTMSLATGAPFARDMICDAWIASANARVLVQVSSMKTRRRAIPLAGSLATRLCNSSRLPITAASTLSRHRPQARGDRRRRDARMARK